MNEFLEKSAAYINDRTGRAFGQAELPDYTDEFAESLNRPVTGAMDWGSISKGEREFNEARRPVDNSFAPTSKSQQRRGRQSIKRFNDLFESDQPAVDARIPGDRGAFDQPRAPREPPRPIQPKIKARPFRRSVNDDYMEDVLKKYKGRGALAKVKEAAYQGPKALTQSSFGQEGKRGFVKQQADRLRGKDFSSEITDVSLPPRAQAVEAGAKDPVALDIAAEVGGGEEVEGGAAAEVRGAAANVQGAAAKVDGLVEDGGDAVEGAVAEVGAQAKALLEDGGAQAKALLAKGGDAAERAKALLEDPANAAKEAAVRVLGKVIPPDTKEVGGQIFRALNGDKNSINEGGDELISVLKNLTASLTGVDIADADIPGLDVITSAATLVAGVAAGVAGLIQKKEPSVPELPKVTGVQETVAADV